MSNCYASPRHGGEITVKNNLSVAEKTRLHWIQRNPTEHKAGECSTTQAGQLFPNIALLIFTVCLHQWLFNYFFCLPPPQTPDRISKQTLWRYFNREGICTTQGHRTYNLGASSSPWQSLYVSTTDWKAGGTQHPQQWGPFLPW